MKAVILAAAKKDSMFPFSETKPVSMLPLDSEPLLARLVGQLRGAGVEEIRIVTHHLEDQIEEYFEEDADVKTVHQEELRGTGYALSICSDLDDDFVVVNGDVVVSGRDLGNLVESHDGSDSDCTVLGTHDSVPEKFGVLSIRDDNVTAIEEKPEDAETSLVNTGIYCFSPRVFGAIESSGSDSLTDAVKEMLDSTKMVVAEDYWIDIGEKRRLLRASKVCRQEASGSVDETAEVHETAELDGDVDVRENARVEAGAYIEGPSIIGSDARIGPNSTVRKSVIGQNSQIEASAVEESVLFENCIVDANNSLESCVLGEGSDFKPGTSARECFIGAESFIDMNNSMRGVKTVPDARTDLSEISK